jgi:azurin
LSKKENDFEWLAANEGRRSRMNITKQCLEKIPMNQSRFLGTICAIFSIFSISTEAALIDLGAGLVYDDVNNITWSQQSSKREWDAANIWAAGLTLGGVMGWRQPTSGELFTLHKNLGATYPGPVPLPQPLFPTLQTDDDSWTGQDRDANVAYIFDFTDGNTRIEIKWIDHYTWAVYTGKVPVYSVGGTVSGLSGTVTLQNNGGDDLTLNSDGSFAFATELADGADFDVMVLAQPIGQTCSVSNSSGQLASADVSNITITCDNNAYLVGGLLTGLVAGDTVVLQNNGGDDLSLNADGAFSFATPVAVGDPYAVTVRTQPSAPSETCNITAGSGTMTANGVNSVSVTCTVNTFTVGGTLAGLAGGGSVVLEINGSNVTTLTANGDFVFSPIADQTAYSVTVATQPTGQTCTVNNGSGQLAGADVSNVTISCVSNTYSLGGVLSGLVSGDMIVLQNNGGDDLTLSADGSFTFASPVTFGAGYAVAVKTQPSAPSETCTVSTGSGTMPANDVNDVSVTCTVDKFTVGVTVSGLAPGQNVVLVNNRIEAISVFQDGGVFGFPTQLPDGTSYDVTVDFQPDGQTCSVTNGSGVVSGAAVTDVTVTCVDIEYIVGGLLSGLAPGDSVVLQNNGGDNLTLTADGAFSFSGPLNAGDSYAVTVLTQPQAPSESCTVINGGGTVGFGDVTNIAVTCTIDNFTVGGALSGLSSGQSIVLQNNGGNDLTLTANGSFTFSAPLADTTDYAVSIRSQPSGQTCTLANASGTLAGSNVTNVGINCTEDEYTLGGLLSGLEPGDTVILQNNGGDDLTLTGNGSFTFPTPLNFGDVFAVTVASQPSAPSETCTVTLGNRTMPANDVTNVSVTCAVDTFTVGGALTGLLSGGSVVLQVNGTLAQTLTADGNFVFPPLADGTAYTVTVAASQPPSQTCSVSNGSGLLAGADVSDIAVSCTLFYEGIPVLDRYGLALLALLMLSAGFIGARRLV